MEQSTAVIFIAVIMAVIAALYIRRKFLKRAEAEKREVPVDIAEKAFHNSVSGLPSDIQFRTKYDWFYATFIRFSSVRHARRVLGPELISR